MGRSDTFARKPTQLMSFLDPLLVLQLLLLGAGTGFLAGLLGIGGGMLMVPFLTMILSHRGIEPGLAVKMAIATSMATILFTSIASVRAHHKRGAVRWPVARSLVPGILMGGLLSGAGLFALLRGSALALVFAVFVVFSAVQMLIDRKAKPGRQMPGPVGATAAGGIIGLISGLVGAGGGFLVGLTSIPWRESWKYGERAFRYCQHDLGHALGALRYAAALFGWRAAILPQWSDDATAAVLGIDRPADYDGAERELAECVVGVTPGSVEPWVSRAPDRLVAAARALGLCFRFCHQQRVDLQPVCADVLARRRGQPQRDVCRKGKRRAARTHQPASRLAVPYRAHLAAPGRAAEL